MRKSPKYRISGHESFPCRYAWLPKAVKWIGEKPLLFAKEQQAMVDLGVGKNMVRAIRFWAQAADMIESLGGQAGYRVTPLGHAILDDPKGADPFLEDIRTLWLIHWKLSTNTDSPLLAWDYLLNRWQDPILASSSVVRALMKEAALQDQNLSSVTIQQHFDTFLHTYVPTRGRKGDVQEDNLDSPLVELELLVRTGEREADAGERREAIYAFRREEKPEITPELFAYCVIDFWWHRYRGEETMPIATIANGHGSPGQILKLREEDIRTRLATLERDTAGALTFSDAASLQQVRRKRWPDSHQLLRAIYALENVYV
jgi:Protein of unknown function (DUF4007)